ncbi:MAG: hypothetical protein HY051_06305 [Candidatus Aenigmarchaeota archaeon]|nr:hypothetical protein [Candidatus Aenigmarchaeota archaeon]
MAHEIWHLVEDEQGVFEQNTLITEGTATYAAARLLDRRCDDPPENFADYMNALYVGGANLVQNRVETERYPFAAILDPRIRAEMQEELIERIMPRIETLVRETLKNPDYRQAAANSLAQVPEFADLRGNLTGRGVIEAYRSLGGHMLADELETQDVSGFIRSLKEIGF